MIVERVTDLTAMLRSVGDIDLPHMAPGAGAAPDPGAPDRSDPDRAERGWKPRPRSDRHFRDRPGDRIPIRSHDFH